MFVVFNKILLIIILGVTIQFP